MADEVTLRDGTPGWVWPLLPTDRNVLVAEFESLSPESRRRRFLGPVVHLSDAMLQHLVGQLPRQRPGEPGRRRPRQWRPGRLRCKQ